MIYGVLLNCFSKSQLILLLYFSIFLSYFFSQNRNCRNPPKNDLGNGLQHYELSPFNDVADLMCDTNNLVGEIC